MTKAFQALHRGPFRHIRKAFQFLSLYYFLLLDIGLEWHYSSTTQPQNHLNAPECYGEKLIKSVLLTGGTTQ
jgi:hypothetical protein